MQLYFFVSDFLSEFSLCFGLLLTLINLQVRGPHVFLIAREQRLFCLAIMSAKGFTTLGAFQQQNTRIIYNLGMRINKLSFVPEDCTTKGA